MKLFLFLLVLVPFAAHAQGTVGNGGKALAAYLTSAIVEIDAILFSRCLEIKNKNELQEQICNSAKPLFDQINKTKIGTATLVYGKTDHQARDAINDTLIENNKTLDFITFSIRNLYAATPDERRRIFLHEFMTLIHKETSDSYGFSAFVILFLKDQQEFQLILKDLPQLENQSKTFKGLEATLFLGEERLLVSLDRADTYRYFCIAKGYSTFTTSYLEDLPYPIWYQQNKIKLRVAHLSEEGVIMDDLISKPDQAVQVISSVTCE